MHGHLFSAIVVSGGLAVLLGSVSPAAGQQLQMGSPQIVLGSSGTVEHINAPSHPLRTAPSGTGRCGNTVPMPVAPPQAATVPMPQAAPHRSHPPVPMPNVCSDPQRLISVDTSQKNRPLTVHGLRVPPDLRKQRE